MDVAFLVAEIEELGVRFRVERFHVGIEGREQTVIAIDYPNAKIEDLVYEQIQILRRRRRQVRSYLLTRPSGLFDLLASRFAEISRSVGQKESTEDAVAITAAAAGRLQFNEGQLELLCGERGICTQQALGFDRFVE
jgi:hypothetical protein